MAERKLDIIVQAKDRVAAGLKSIQKRLSNFAKRVAQVGVVATAAASAAIIEMGRRGAAAVDALAKLARRTGENINTLNALRGAADRAGVGADTLTQALTRAQKRIGEVAATGGGAAAKGLDLLGLSAQELVDLPIAQQLERIAERMKDVQTEGERSAIAQAFFGAEGRSMTLMLENGADAFRESIRHAARFRAELSQVGAEGVEAANDAIADLRDSLTSIGQLIAIRMAPQIEQFAAQLAERMASVADQMATIFTEPFRGLLTAINKGFDGAVESGGDMAQRIMDAMEVVSRRIGEFFATIPERIKVVKLHIEDLVRDIEQALLGMVQRLPPSLKWYLGVDDTAVGRRLSEGRERQREISDIELPEARRELEQGRQDFRHELLDRMARQVEQQQRRILDLQAEGASKSIEQQQELVRTIEQRAQALEELAREQERLGHAERTQTGLVAQATRDKAEREREALSAMREHRDGLRGLVGVGIDFIDGIRRRLRAGDEAEAGEAQRRVAAQAPSLETGRLITGAAAARGDVDQKQLEEQRKHSSMLGDIKEGVADTVDTLRDILSGGGFNGRIGGLIGS